MFNDTKIVTFLSYLLIQMYLFFTSKYLFEKYVLSTLYCPGPALQEL